VSEPRVPVYLLTGFLGSGKTTLLNALLPGYPDSALVINELGDIGIDDQLIEGQSVPVTLLAGGCVCCTVRGSLNSTLRNLWMARRAGSIPRFARLIVETTGAADPWGLVDTLSRDTFLRRHFQFAAVLTTVDARRGVEGLRAYPEVIEQVLVADTLLMTRADQVSAEQLNQFRCHLAELNGAARIEPAQPGRLPANLLDDTAEARCRFTGLPMLSGLTPMTVAENPSGVHRASGLQVAAPVSHPGSTLHAASMRLQVPLERWLLMRVLEQVLGESARYLLRFKGLFHIADEAGPLLVQAVAQGMDEPVSLSVWPSADTDSRMVLIVDHQDADYPHQVLHRIATLLHAARDH
jgi:G3E family GTPase